MATTGQTIGNYRLLAKLGEGGMGEVFRGIDLMLERTVAIKALHPELARRGDLVVRFREEAIILARLHHQNIATLFNFFRDGDHWFMVMEYAPGETLDGLIAGLGHGMPWKRAVGLTTQCLQALEHAHSQGVIHRDLKPANIMVSEQSSVKVMDFGIARLVGGDRLTRTGYLVGTPAYMTPEQIQGREADARSDLYSLGIILYEMLSGQPPFRAGSDYELLKAQVEALPRPLRERVPQLPVALEQALERVLAKQPGERFQTALDFRLALEVLSSRAVPPQPTRIFPVETPPTRHAIPSQSATEEERRRVEAAEAQRLAEKEAQPVETEATPQTKKDDRQPEAIERERQRELQEVERHAGEDETRLAVETTEYRPDDSRGAVAPTRAAISPEAKQIRVSSSEGLERDTIAGQASPKVEPTPPSETPQARRRGRFVVIALATIAGVAFAITAYFLPIFREDQQIAHLIQQAQEALAAGRLTEPEDNSALSYVRQVLRIDAENFEARRILHLAIDARLQEGLDALREGDLRKAVEVQEEAEVLVGSYRAIRINTKPLTDAIRAEQELRVAAEEEQRRKLEEAERMHREEETRRAEEEEQKRQAETATELETEKFKHEVPLTGQATTSAKPAQTANSEPASTTMTDAMVAEDTLARIREIPTHLIQAALHELGYYKGKLDGLIGPGTRSAISAFQQTHGFEVTGDLTSAQKVALIESAAKAGHPQSQNTLGMMAASGIGVAKDEAAARRWFEASADHGNAHAAYNLGLLYRHGRSVEKSADKARKYFEQARAGGHMKAVAELNALGDER